MKLNDKGKNLFQVKYIKWSYRMRGSVARTQTNNIDKAKVFNNRIKESRILVKIDLENKHAVISLMAKMLVYSAIKIRANNPLLNSTLNPETSSDSPSAKSKGVRLVSARFVINHKIVIKGTIRINQDF
jgi:hypothetical protein